MLPPRQRWNHNLHHHPIVLGAVPAGCVRALDVGCGEGILARELRAVVPEVVGIDLDEPSIAAARSAGGDIEYVLGDVLTHPFEQASFDLVASVATLHHMDARAGLERMAALVAPGGTLVVIGLARSTTPVDFAHDAIGVVMTRVLRARRGWWEHSAPTVWPPPVTYSQMRRLAAEVLPGARFRRHRLFRYSLAWQKPVRGT